MIAKAKVALFAIVLALVRQAQLNAGSCGSLVQRGAPRNDEEVLCPLYRNARHRTLRMRHEVYIEFCVKLQNYLSIDAPVISCIKLEVFLMLCWLASASCHDNAATRLPILTVYQCIYVIIAQIDGYLAVSLSLTRHEGAYRLSEA